MHASYHVAAGVVPKSRSVRVRARRQDRPAGDLVAKSRFRGKPLGFLIHVESQAKEGLASPIRWLTTRDGLWYK
jgi:hypothetical protein